ncbi:hypothetical protein RB195_021676 [Necator americanus]|uniref:G domain-containing protein n=2 Tax=Necator americanus TaxID=51031 RepID=A0ABR1ECE2_NECAM
MDTKSIKSINLDDIFPSETVHVEHTEKRSHTTTTHTENVSSYSSTSVIQNSHSIHSVEVHQAPEPKSRTSLTEASKMENNNTIQHRHTMNDDDLLASIFDAVKLPDVHYTQDHHYAIQHIDDALAGEETDYHYDESSVISESHRSSTNTNYTTNTSTAGIRNVSNRVAESVMQQAMDDLQLVSQDESDYANEPTTIVNQENGRYEPYSMYCTYVDSPRQPSSRRGTNDNRLRTMTLDSSVSATESRVGGFDVHHDDGNSTAEEINLHHDEVAYVRPKLQANPETKAAPPPINYPKNTGDTIKLRKLNAEVAVARQRQAQLAAQIEHEKAEVERLRQFKQQSLAREAAARFHQQQYKIGTGVAVRSDSVSTDGKASTIQDTRSSGDSIYDEEPVKISEIAERQLNNGNTVSTVGNVNIVVPELEIVQGFSKNRQIRKVIIGGHQAPTDEDKTILLFGPVGSGKTSTINSMLNYLYDVKRENNFRFALSEVTKKTEALTAYVINNTVLPFSVTIVDTPGVVNIHDNTAVSTLIKTWFEQELREAGAFRLDVISIVLSHNERALGWPFINELAAVKHMLGDDLKTNVLPIITNSEVLPQPVAVRSLALANISFVEYYKCNNLGFMPNVTEIPKLQHNLFFSHGMASLEAYFRDLQELIHPLLAILRGAKRSPSNYSYSDTNLY